MVKLFFFYICLPNHDDDDRQCGDVGGENVDILDLCHRFLIAMMMKKMMTDSGDVGGENVEIVDLCLRSLIDPGRWRAPARSSWSPFFINNSETTKAPKIHPPANRSLGSLKMIQAISLLIESTLPISTDQVIRPQKVGLGERLGARGYFQNGGQRPTEREVAPPLY